jgi:hypothetical protein
MILTDCAHSVPAGCAMAEDTATHAVINPAISGRNGLFISISWIWPGVAQIVRHETDRCRFIKPPKT